VRTAGPTGGRHRAEPARHNRHSIPAARSRGRPTPNTALAPPQRRLRRRILTLRPRLRRGCRVPPRLHRSRALDKTFLAGGERGPSSRSLGRAQWLGGDAPTDPHPAVKFVKINRPGENQEPRRDEFLASPPYTGEPPAGDNPGALCADIVAALSYLAEVIIKGCSSAVALLAGLRRGVRRTAFRLWLTLPQYRTNIRDMSRQNVLAGVGRHCPRIRRP
jgi:hypothetical protein